MAKMINDDFVKCENSKNDEYIRLDTTIIGIDNLIAKASSAEEANALFKAKDVIYSQQKHFIYRQPVKHGKWENGHCTHCGEDVASKLDTWTDVQNFIYCPNCGSKNRMDGDNDA